MALRSNGLKSKRKSAPAPEEPIHRSPTGKLRVRDPAFMAAMHATRIEPLRLGVAPPVGVNDLHHGKNPEGGARRTNDASCVLLDHAEHMVVDSNDVPYNVPFGAWAAMHYWSYRNGLLDDEDRGQKFLKWTLEQLEAKQ